MRSGESEFSISPRILKYVTINVFPTRVEAILSIRRKNPSFDFPYGTSLHGPALRNLAIPREAEKTDVHKAIIVWFDHVSIPLRYSKEVINVMIWICGILSMNGSES